MRLEFSPWVKGDLSVITDRIAEHSTTNAQRMFNLLNDEIESIGRSPLLHRLRPDLGNNARVAIVGQYLILFQVVDSCVRIERVVHGNRQLSSLYREALQNG